MTSPTPLPSASSPAASAGAAHISRLSAAASRLLARCRPWHELLAPSAFSRPASLPAAASRVRRNAAHFRHNYAALLAASLLLSLLAHPAALLLLALLLAAWAHLYLLRPADAPQPAVLGHTFSDREVLAALSASTFVAVFFTSIASLVVSALLAGAAVAGLHAALRDPDDLFLVDGRVNDAAVVADLV